MDSISNNVSFEGKYETERNYKSGTRPRHIGHNNSRHSTNPNRVYNSDGDSYEPKKDSVYYRKKAQAKKIAQMKKEQKAKILLATILSALTVGGSAAGINAIQTNQKEPDAGFYTNNHSIVEVSDFTGIPSHIIAAANKDANVEKNLPEKIVMPTKLEENNDDVDIYTDGKYAYIEPLHDISMEDLKNELGIKDGVIRNYNNNISYTYASENTASGDCVSYKDYTDSNAANGSVVKVPIKELNQSNQE